MNISTYAVCKVAFSLKLLPHHLPVITNVIHMDVGVFHVRSDTTFFVKTYKRHVGVDNATACAFQSHFLISLLC